MIQDLFLFIHFAFIEILFFFLSHIERLIYLIYIILIYVFINFFF